jgi:hypothetical protein
MSDFCPMFGFPAGPWHRWFAWFPVETFDGGWKWLTFIERRRIHKKASLDGPPHRWWQYRRFPAPALASNK